MWLARREVPLPPRHRRMPLVLGGLAALGAAPLAYGVAVFDPWATLLGLAVCLLGKLWFVDRMVWLYEDTRRGGPRG